MNNLGFYRDKYVLITGAAHGLGKALSNSFAKEGARLILLDVDGSALTQTEEELKNKGIDVISSIVDISNAKEVNQFAISYGQQHQHLDILVNNAGISHHGHLNDSDINDFNRVIQTNLMGTVHMAKVFIPYLKKSKHAILANISSGIALMGIPGFSAYAASKAGVRAVSQSLRSELVKDNILVSCIFPGPINTRIYDRAKHVNPQDKFKEENYLSTKGYNPEYFAKIILRGLQRRKTEMILGKEVWWANTLVRLFPKTAEILIRKYQHKLPV